MTNETIGRFIASLRMESGLTQEQLAERIGVSNRSVSRWENGKTLPDLSVMQLLCREFGISISELLGGARQSFAADGPGDLCLLPEYADRKCREKSVRLRRYFLWGLFFLLLAFFTDRIPLPLFPNARVPQEIIPCIFLCIGIAFEAAGFFQNRITPVFTRQQLAVMLQPEDRLKMTTSEAMLQFACMHQKGTKKQHRLAFAKIAEALAGNEYATFSMIADSCQINNQPVRWHVSLAVTNCRLLLCAEGMRGVLIPNYRTECCGLKDILSAERAGQKILIRTKTHTLSVTVSEPDTVLPRLQKALKTAS